MRSTPVTGTPSWHHRTHDAPDAPEEWPTDLRSALADFEPERLSGPDAARLLETFSEIEKLAVRREAPVRPPGGVVQRLAPQWPPLRRRPRRRSHRDRARAGHHTLQAARQLGSLPATEEAMRDGRLSETQVKEIAGAAILQPEAEQGLVDTAENQPLDHAQVALPAGEGVGRDQHEGLRGHPSGPVPPQLDRRRRSRSASTPG